MQRAYSSSPDERDAHVAWPLASGGRTAPELAQLLRQHPATDRGALGGRPPAAVLLDRQPAVIVALREDGEDRRQVNDARAELREQPRPDGLIEVRQAACAQVGEDVCID